MARACHKEYVGICQVPQRPNGSLYLSPYAEGVRERQEVVVSTKMPSLVELSDKPSSLGNCRAGGGRPCPLPSPAWGEEKGKAGEESPLDSYRLVVKGHGVRLWTEAAHAAVQRPRWPGGGGPQR